MAIELHYYKAQGLLAPICLFCEYLGQDYKIIYRDSDFNWKKSQANYNLPILKEFECGSDKSLELSTTWPIMKYLARKHQQGIPEFTNNQALSRAENLEVILSDVYNIFCQYTYLTGCSKTLFLSQMQQKFTIINDIIRELSENFCQLFLIGEGKISYLDFYLYFMVKYYCQLLGADHFYQKFGYLELWYQRFESEINKYDSDGSNTLLLNFEEVVCNKLPINNCMARWGNSVNNDFSTKI